MTLSPHHSVTDHVASDFAGQRLLPRPRSLSILWLALPIFLLTMLSGCSRLKKPAKPEMVYVVTQQVYLRDRVAPVANRVALVRNGEPLEVVEREHRFFKVKNSKNEIGWIEDHLVIEEPVYDQFVALGQQHEHDPVVATGVLRDALYLHLKPGRTTERFYLLAANDKLQLLVRASIPKSNSQQSPIASPKPAVNVASSPGKTAPAKGSASPAPALRPPVPMPAPMPLPMPVPMEDWWLARDSQGHTGWLLARQLDVEIPDAIGGYSEGQKMVGAYILDKVDDPESSLPDHQVPQYLAVLNAYKDGLPYDFDQIRVFTWNVKKHRYETAYRQRNFEGYLPVEVSDAEAGGGQAGQAQANQLSPGFAKFAIKVASTDAVTTDPLTGALHPAEMQTLRFELDGNIVKKILPSSGDAAAPVKPHPAPASPGRHGRAARRHASP